MPDLVKIGFSTKDPQARAAELNHTGNPHPYKVEYDVLVDDPRKIEQAIHGILKNKNLHENKEWFKCSTQLAIQEIRDVVGNQIIVENLYERTNFDPNAKTRRHKKRKSNQSDSKKPKFTKPKPEPAKNKTTSENTKFEPFDAENLDAKRLELEAEMLKSEEIKTKRLKAEKLDAKRLELETEMLKSEKIKAKRLEAEKLEAKRLELEAEMTKDKVKNNIPI